MEKKTIAKKAKTEPKKVTTRKVKAEPKKVITKKVKEEPKKVATKRASRKELFTKDMTLGEVLMKKPEAQAILFGFGMHCFGCPVTQFETIEEAAMVHDVDLKLLLKKLNEN